jgi:hypothetical protein
LPNRKISLAHMSSLNEPVRENNLTRSMYCICLCAVLILCALASAMRTLHWPLVGDASLMHYVVFLTHAGYTPYKSIADINLPGSYLAEATAMHIFGGGPLGWHLYDLTLCLVLLVAAVKISSSKQYYAGIFTGTFFLLIHLQDGLAQSGQRDLLIAALLTCAYALLFAAQSRPRNGLLILLFGLLLGFTITIKPFFLPLGALLILMSMRRARQHGLTPGIHLACGTLGLLFPSAAMMVWLWSQHALRPFLATLTGLIPLHATLGHKPVAYLLTHSVSPIMPLCIAWAIVWILRRQPVDLERIELLAGIAIALLAYIAQGKGFPYHRYSLLALLLLPMGMDFFEALKQTGAARVLSILALAYACFFIAPRATLAVRSFTTTQPFQQGLAHDLQAHHADLSGGVQCIDTLGGCINTLYDLKIVQSTGFLYDCYLFLPGHNPVTDQYRAAFWAAFQQARPKVLILTSQYCFGPDSFQKINTWPQFADNLAHSYTQVTEWHPTQQEHWWTRLKTPSQFRIYIRKP